MFIKFLDKCRQNTSCVSDQYLFSGVSSLQAAIDSSIIQVGGY